MYQMKIEIGLFLKMDMVYLSKILGFLGWIQHMGSAVFSLRNAGIAHETAVEVEKRQRCSYAKRLCSYTTQLGWVKQVQISSKVLFKAQI